LEYPSFIVGRDIAYYMQGLGLEPQTPHFSTFKKWVLLTSAPGALVKETKKEIFALKT